MIEVTDIRSTARAEVTIRLTGTEPMRADYSSRTFQPSQVKVTYVYRTQRSEDGWTQHAWQPVNVTVIGPRILKPAPDGSQRLGVDVLRYNPPHPDEAPAWVRRMITELAPSGDPALAGA